MNSNVHNSDIIKGVNLYLRPTYIVAMPNFPRRKKGLSLLQQKNLINLERNKPNGKMSKKARQRLVNSVNWLVACSKKKWVYSKERKRYFSFRLNFITLTLPGDLQEISDHQFKSKLLHNFINQCRYHYNLKNYIWKVEAQANGKIHAHFTTDTYMNWKGVRKIWNKILKANGLLDLYKAKHSAMSLGEYIAYYKAQGVKDVELLKKRYLKGVAECWENPNSTDVHAVYKVKDVGAYLSKYMAKDEEDRRKIKGRLWACNYNLSLANRLYVHLPSEMNSEIYSILEDMRIEKADIWTKDADREYGTPIGRIFFIKLKELLNGYSNELTDLYRKILFNLRYNLDIHEIVFGTQIKKDFTEIQQNEVESKKVLSSEQLQLNLSRF